MIIDEFYEAIRSMKCLFVSNTIKENPQSGGEYGVLRDFKMVIDTFGQDNVKTFCFETLGNSIRKAKMFKKAYFVFNILKGYLGGVNEENEGIRYDVLIRNI